jgi:hypothetical protein
MQPGAVWEAGLTTFIGLRLTHPISVGFVIFNIRFPLGIPLK